MIILSDIDLTIEKRVETFWHPIDSIFKYKLFLYTNRDYFLMF